MDSRVIELTGAAHKYGNLNIRPCGKDFFPEGIFGGSSKEAGLGVQITLEAEGLVEPIKTDIPTDKKSGGPRWLFRERAWVKKFVKVHKLRTGDRIVIRRIDHKRYRVTPDGDTDGQPLKTEEPEKEPESSSPTREPKLERIYRKAAVPTKASEVTADTPLESLNLNWSEKDLPERERTKHVHRLHPYLGKFIPQLVEIFLRKYFKRGQRVLDPFCGCGTTLVQANELGIHAIGYDVSAFNVLLCRVKITKYDLSKVRAEVMNILEKVRSATDTKHPQLDLWGTEVKARGKWKDDDEYLRRWYAPRALRELVTYRQLIEKEGYYYQDLLKIILSRSARSARLTTHFDLDFPKKPQTEPYWCYKHSRMCAPTTVAFKFLRRYSIDTLVRLREFGKVRANATVSVHRGDSRIVGFPPIDGIITSPPYVGLIDYHEQHAYAYHLLGLEENREDEIGSPTNGSGEVAQRKYQKEIAQVFRRAFAAMPRGGYAIVVARDRAKLYDKIAKMSGAAVEYVLQRHVNRRTGRRANEFFESVFIWRKV